MTFSFPSSGNQLAADSCVLCIKLGGGGRSEKVEPESTFGETQPVTLYNPAMREDKNITRKRGEHLSSFDNIKSKSWVWAKTRAASLHHLWDLAS